VELRAGDSLDNIIELPENFFNFRRLLVSEKEFIRVQQEVLEGKKKDAIRGTLGSYVFTLKTRTQDIRYIREDATREVRGEKLAVSEVAKSILYTLAKNNYFGKKRKSGYFYYRKHHLDILENHSLPAIYCRTGQYHDMVYLDIKAFYFTIYSRFIDCEYERGRFLGYGKGLPKDFIAELQGDKQLRNTIFGIMRTRRLTEWRKGQGLRCIKTNNEYLNPQLCILTYDISQAIARVMIEEFGAVYYYIDGIILPLENELKAIQFLEQLGFKVERRTGGSICVVKSTGCYAFYDMHGELVYATKHYERRKAKEEGTISSNLYLSPEETKFLLSRLSI